MEYLRSETEEIFFERKKENCINLTGVQKRKISTALLFITTPIPQISEISKFSRGGGKLLALIPLLLGNRE